MGLLDFMKPVKPIESTPTINELNNQIDSLIKSNGELKSVARGAEPKSSFFDPYAYSDSTYGYKQKFSRISYDVLKRMSYQDPIVSAIIQTRLNQVANFAIPQPDKFKVGFKIEMKDDEAEKTPELEEARKNIETFMLNCGVKEELGSREMALPERSHFENFLRKVVRDSLTYDALTFEIVPRVDGKPYEFYAMDASTIRICSGVGQKSNAMELGVTKNTPRKDIAQRLNYPAYFLTDPDRGNDDPKFLQIVNGRVQATYGEEELCYGIRNPRTDLGSNGYGLGELELLVAVVTADLNQFTYNRNFFTQGSAIKGVLNFEGNIPPRQMEAFKRQWHAQVAGVNNAWKTPIVNSDKLSFVSMHQGNREMEYSKWVDYLIKLITGVYLIDPSEINFDISRTGGGMGMGTSVESSNVQKQTMSKDKGLGPLLRFVQTQLNKYIIDRLDDRFEFTFVGLNAKSEKEHQELQVQQVSNWKTIDEIRAENDMEPLEDEGGGHLVLNPIWMQWYQQEQANKAEGMGEAGEDFSEGEDNYEDMDDGELQDELNRMQSVYGDEIDEKNNPTPEEPEKPEKKKEPFKKAFIELEL